MIGIYFAVHGLISFEINDVSIQMVKSLELLFLNHESRK